MTDRREERTTLSTADVAGKRPPAPAGGENGREAQMAAERREIDHGREQPRTNEPATGNQATAATMTRPPAASAGGDQRTTPLLPGEQTSDYRSQWESIQTGFVDEPRQAVEKADHLVAEVIKRIAEVFADERGKLEEQWSRGNEVNTEDLRVALTRYRSFFERLLSA